METFKWHHKLSIVALILDVSVGLWLLIFFSKHEIELNKWERQNEITGTLEEEKRGGQVIAIAVANVLFCWFLIQRIVVWKHYMFPRFSESILDTTNRRWMILSLTTVMVVSCVWIFSWLADSPIEFQFPGPTFLSWYSTVIALLCISAVVGISVSGVVYFWYVHLLECNCSHCWGTCYWTCNCSDLFQSCCHLIISSIQWLAQYIYYSFTLCHLASHEPHYLESDSDEEEAEEAQTEEKKEQTSLSASPNFHFNPLPTPTQESSDEKKSSSSPSSGLEISYGTMISWKQRTNETVCCICVLEFNPHDEIHILPCFHYLHSSCQQELIRNSKLSNKELNCPVCRIPFKR